MMPNQPMNSNPMMGAGSVPVGPGPATGAGGANPDTIKRQLVQLLSQARKMAEQNGVDWNAVLSEVSGNKVRSDISLPRPPIPTP